MLAVVALLVVAAATITAVILSRPHGDESPYHAQTLIGTLGTVHLSDRPRSVAALGPGDPDAVLSLGVQPVVMTAAQGKLPGWLQNLVHSGAPVLSAPDASAIATARPDLVIDTGSLGQIDYAQLSSIAPTLTRPAHPTQDWTWQAQLTWIAGALGRGDTATRLLNDAAAQQSQTRAAHPAFAGKTVAAINVSDTGITADLADTSPGAYLSALGFRYSDALKRGPAEAGEARPVPDLATLPTEVLVVIRTDKAAGGGSYNGLPSALTSYRGAVIIVDDPDVIAALNTGGYAAVGYLNSSFVNAVAQQVH